MTVSEKVKQALATAESIPPGKVRAVAGKALELAQATVKAAVAMRDAFAGRKPNWIWGAAGTFFYSQQALIHRVALAVIVQDVSAAQTVLAAVLRDEGATEHHALRSRELLGKCADAWAYMESWQDSIVANLLDVQQSAIEALDALLALLKDVAVIAGEGFGLAAFLLKNWPIILVGVLAYVELRK